MIVPRPCWETTRPFSVSAVVASRTTVRLTSYMSHSTFSGGSTVPDG
jgi:hypothetical protein